MSDQSGNGAGAPRRRQASGDDARTAPPRPDRFESWAAKDRERDDRRGTACLSGVQDSALTDPDDDDDRGN
jgi:hypothetical protein